MEKIHHYETSVKWVRELEGSIEGRDLPTLATAPPPEFGGPGGFWSPEHLFVSSVNVCVMLTFFAIARFSKLDVKSWRSTARGTAEKVEGEGWQFTGIDIESELGLASTADEERARRLAEKAERQCLISQSIKCPVRLQLSVRPDGA